MTQATLTDVQPPTAAPVDVATPSRNPPPKPLTERRRWLAFSVLGVATLM